jgi:adenylyltransferase/sulfurtransferase
VPWFDGGIEVLNGIVRGFAPPDTACYECTMSAVDWKELDQRRSCSLLARRSVEGGGTPTTPTTASIIGAMLCLEVIKHLHGMDCLRGQGYLFEGANYSSYRVEYPVKPDCEWHGERPRIETARELGSRVLLDTVWTHAARLLGGLDAIDFEREIVTHLECGACAAEEAVYQPVENVGGERVPCPSCGRERAPRLLHSVSSGSKELGMTVGDIGLPSWDIVWARKGEQVIGIELAGDAPPGGNGHTE